MIKHLGSGIGIVLGILAIIAGFASEYRGRGTGAGDLIISGPMILLGALAYRSAKRRYLGQAGSTPLRRTLEAIAMLIVIALVFLAGDPKTLIAEQPAHYVIVPVWVLLAYALVGFRAPKHAANNSAGHN